MLAQLSNSRILVCDQDAGVRAFLRSILAGAGYDVLEAANGQEALEIFGRELPEMVMIDVMISGDAYAVVKEITQKLARHFVPVIFLTADSSEEVMLKCIDSGGDEVLSKPFNPVLLLARVRAMFRIVSLYASLEDYRAQTEEELVLARHVFSTITQRMREIIPGLAYWTESAGHLPGDLILYDTAPSGQVYAMMADFTGHGFSAAVGAIPVADIFFALTRKDFPLADIIVEINRKLRQIFPVGHFCAAGFVSSDPTQGRVQVWNGGLPELLLVDQQRHIVDRFPSRNLALGIIDMRVDQVQLMDVSDALGSKLIMYTDGLTEAANKEGQPFGHAHLEQTIRDSEGLPLFDVLKRAVTDYLKGVSPADDISLLVLPIRYSDGLDIWTD
jgi:CheY-like chemotaxis protein